MKKTFMAISFAALVGAVWGQKPVLFDVFALDGDKSQAIKTIERSYSGRYEVDEEGGYVIEVDDATTVSVWFVDESIDAIVVEKRGAGYAAFLATARKLLDIRGEPAYSSAYDGSYRLGWRGKRNGETEPSFDLTLRVTLAAPFTMTEAVFYGK